MKTIKTTTAMLSPGVRRLLAVMTVLLAILLLAGALTIPFIFESPSMWYKFGLDKTSLRIGKMIGLAAGVLILLQLVLAGRFKSLDRVFSMPGLIRLHRIHAWVIVILALLHPTLVLYSEKMLMIPLEMRYWPEWVGVGLWIMILLQFIGSQVRLRMGIDFHVWMILHRIGGLLIAALLTVHVLYVSESFTDNGIPAMAVMVAAAVFGMAWLWVRSGWLRARRRPYAVKTVEPAGTDSTCVTLGPLTQKPFAYLPGQFAIVSFRSTHLGAEPHPFTLSSTPGRDRTLAFTIRACGDWTRRTGRLQPGDKALIQGPFGRFGHLFTAPGRELILIAGGIGITPMLSMLRFMADAADTRPISLIWSNRTRRHMVHGEEMKALAAKLTGLRWIPIFTRESHGNPRSGRLDRDRLSVILSPCSRRAAIFLCGPPAMMRQLKQDLKALGFPSRSIHTEAFGF